MPISKPELWKQWENNNDDDYGKACIKISEKVMEYLDEMEPLESIDAMELIMKADRHYKEGITGFMASVVASMVSSCHDKGKRFEDSWKTGITV